jgi:hypothetical protein
MRFVVSIGAEQTPGYHFVLAALDETRTEPYLPIWELSVARRLSITPLHGSRVGSHHIRLMSRLMVGLRLEE